MVLTIKKRKSKLPKVIGFMVGVLAIVGGGCWWYSDASNPYGQFSVVKPFFVTKVEPGGDISLQQIAAVHFVDNPVTYAMTFVQRFFRIAGNARMSEAPLQGDEQAIIKQIHAERYRVDKPYIVTGPNFSEFYVRNQGIFFASMLDNRFGLSQADWVARQRVMLQTVATHLELLKKAGKEYTTFVPVWDGLYTAENWNAPPSDSLYSAYYTLSALNDSQFIAKHFPASSPPLYTLQTHAAAQQLIDAYKPLLARVTNAYLSDIISPSSGLIKKNLALSSARDGLRRYSSFYDNVIAWSTAQLATDLGIPVVCPVILQTHQACDFTTWKQRIKAAFWDEQTGIFLDDLSDESKRDHLFSADAFIEVQTGFLDITNPAERAQLGEQITYVQQHKLDKPLPIHYASRDQPDRLYFFVRYFAPSYMGESIWSHWGMEYSKSLVLLAAYDPTYLAEARAGLDAYKERIEHYGGYPELYNKDGTIFQNPLYKGVLRTGWVINYEQAKMLYATASKSVH